MTPHQFKVLELVSTGASNKSIASKLGVTEKTVKFHLTKLYKANNVKNRTELAILFQGKLDQVRNEVRLWVKAGRRVSNKTEALSK